LFDPNVSTLVPKPVAMILRVLQNELSLNSSLSGKKIPKIRPTMSYPISFPNRDSSAGIKKLIELTRQNN
jgi:hypothetical protein